MKVVQQISGKVGIKHVFLFFIIFSILIAGSFHAPFIARYAHSRIKVGMAADEVRIALRGLGRYYLSCETDLNVKDNAVFHDDKCFTLVSALPGQQKIKKVKMRVLFMGPVFWHNDFVITFESDGKVKHISPVRGWD